ncbi:MAG TPA: site-specific DNA-methyltransferase [Armatimonadota bacterium]|nr:site-specific DNA-methyltransferase [Armatimonadota bacterium]
MARLSIHYGDNLPILRSLPSDSVDLIYIDPPFNTGKVQSLTRISTTMDENGDRTGFQGKRYKTVTLGTRSYSDLFDDYLSFLDPRLVEGYRVLKADGSLFFHIDYREAHYCKVLLDVIFGRASFMNEIIWAYDYGGRSKTRWPAKHNNIFWYAKNPDDYQFHLNECDRIPYMAPGLVGPKKAARGKTPTDTWWHTIVSPNAKERTGYPTQKPRGVLDRIVKVHSRPGDLLMDFFVGSGTFGESATQLGRDCILVDSNPEAMGVMEARFAQVDVQWHDWKPGH